MTLFDGTCDCCLGLGEHFDWCPLLPGSAFAPAASTGAHPARDAQGAASGDDRAAVLCLGGSTTTDAVQRTEGER